MCHDGQGTVPGFAVRAVISEPSFSYPLMEVPMPTATHFILSVPGLLDSQAQIVLASMEGKFPAFTFTLAPFPLVEEPACLPLLGEAGEGAGPMDEHPGQDVVDDLNDALKAFVANPFAN
jgi:hypothetical protein